MDEQLISNFKQALRRVASTVTIITARAEGATDGMTATAVTSLCADPPSLLACVNQSATLSPTMYRAERFCVNVLYSDQEDVSRVFSDPARRHERFQIGKWVLDQDGPPYLADAQANLFCHRMSAIPIETHTVFVGRVYDTRLRSGVAPLLYLNGTYSTADAHRC